MNEMTKSSILKLDAERELAFNELFEKLVYEMTREGKKNIPLIEQTLIEISTMLRLSRGVTRVYRNPDEEHLGGGETLCCFDLGIEDTLVHECRTMTSVMNIVWAGVYMSPYEKPLTEAERFKIDLVLRTNLSFISRNRLHDIVKELAFKDNMGLPNQRSMTKYISANYGTDNFGGCVAVHYNLRHFTLVNQEIGRKSSAAVLIKHFETMRMIIGADGELFRLGGDNFVGIFKRERVKDVLSFLTEASISYADSRAPITVTCTVGVYDIPFGTVINDLSDVMEKIVAAQRAAQSGGKERIVFFSEYLFDRKKRSMRVQQLFPEALRNEEFKVYYQPKVNVMTGEICGAEALCRWFRNGSIVPPGDFIPMLEETIEICRLDLYMLEHVCRDIRRWLDEGRDVVRISVNLSRKHMMNSGLVDTVNDIIDRCGIEHKYIEVELTETTTDDEFNDLKRVVSGLQQAGIFTSVDDFGIGYSSLNLIRAIPWNVLKVDRSFLPVAGDSANSTRSVMFKYVVAMARELGLECIAEGVETEQQLKILRENNCELAQGFLFDRPLPVEEFEKRLEMHAYKIEE